MCQAFDFACLEFPRRRCPALPMPARYQCNVAIATPRSQPGPHFSHSEMLGVWTTKIHTVTDSQGRLFRFLLTPGNCADIATAYELAARLPSNGCLIGDMGYDALELRQTLASKARRASSRPIQRTSTNGRLIWKPIKSAISSSGCSVASGISVGSPPVTTNTPETFPPPLLWSPSSSGGLVESRP